MTKLNINDCLGYFRELVQGSYIDFISIHQSAEQADRDKAIKAFRSLVGLALLLNHLADKVASKKNYKSAIKLLESIKQTDPESFAHLNSIRIFANDIKHPDLRFSWEVLLRERNISDYPGTPDKILTWLGDDGKGNKIQLEDSIAKTIMFWGKHFGGDNPIKDAKKL